MDTGRFGALLRARPGGEAVDEARVLSLYLDALSASDRLRGGPPSDEMLAKGFVHACRNAGLSG